MRLHVKPSASEIKVGREAANLSQSELADLLGVSPRTVQYWEAGKVPRPKHRRALVAFLLETDGQAA